MSKTGIQVILVALMAMFAVSSVADAAVVSTGDARLEVLYESDSGLTLDGAGGGAWNDLSTNARHLAVNEGTAGTLANQFNGKPGVQFPGTDSLSASASGMPTGDPSVTFFTVLEL